MRIAFATTQTTAGSTVTGRTLPLALELAHEHDVHLLILGDVPSSPAAVTWHHVGQEPFERTSTGKLRYRGWQLITNMLGTAWRTYRTLRQLRPELVVIVKPLPANVLGSWLWSWHRASHFILDADDFELFANTLRSLYQRAAIHWSERAALRLSTAVTAATPFLVDHFVQLKPTTTVQLLPTGHTPFIAPPVVQHTPHQLLYLGSISIASGHRVDLLPAILAQVRVTYPDATLVMAGTGDDRAAIEQQFAQQELAGAVTWLGRFTIAQVPTLIGTGTIIIDPIDASIAQRAKSSYRVTLAAAAGCPVVSSNVGVRPYWLPRPLHPRFFATPADPADYARRIVDLFQSPLTAAEQADMRAAAQAYTWTALGQTFSAIISHVCRS